VRSRMGAWDHPSRSHKKFIDIHCAANESCCRMFLPANLGWWSFKTWTGPQGEPTFSDDIEYWCAKALANDSSIEIGVTPESFRRTPAVPRLAAIVKRYEELRRAKYFPETVKEKLRVPGDEFTLVDLEAGAGFGVPASAGSRDSSATRTQPAKAGTPNLTPLPRATKAGRFQFRRVQYDKHKVLGLDGWSNEWKMTNRFGRQPLQLRIEALMSAGPYDAPGNITLADFADTSGFDKRAPNAAISAKLEPSSQCVKIGKVSGCFSATSKMTTRQGAWSSAGKTFSPPANLTGHEALGVWVHGDGKGEVLNLQLKSPSHLSHGIGDHYIVVDFAGWRYFELVEPEGERHADYVWPYPGGYSIYRESIRPSSVETLNLFFNNLPPKDMATCYLSPIRALPTVKAKLRNPSVTLGGKTITFPVEMESGQYLEFRSRTDCKLYGPAGEMLGDVTPQGDAPVLESGDNQVRFTCEPPAGLNPRARVSVISHGELIGEK